MTARWAWRGLVVVAAATGTVALAWAGMWLTGELTPPCVP